jgi:threonine synthase
LQLGAVNSINWGRIVAQLTYYFAAAAALGSPQRSLSFAVPTGNFGDVFAGYAAKAMGLPTERLVLATNENDILHRAWSTGLYALADVIATTSPSMDIQVSSNFERFLFEATGRDAAFVRARMGGLQQSRSVGLGEAMVPYRQNFIAERVDQAQVADCIRRVRKESGYLLDPHSACAVVAARRTLTSQSRHIPHVALATAHPAKFPDAIEAITGERPALPPRLASLMSDPERISILPNDLAAVQRFVEERAGRRQGAAA